MPKPTLPARALSSAACCLLAGAGIVLPGRVVLAPIVRRRFARCHDHRRKPAFDREHAALSSAALRPHQGRGLRAGVRAGYDRPPQGSGGHRQQPRGPPRSTTPSSRSNVPAGCSNAWNSFFPISPARTPTPPSKKSRRRWPPKMAAHMDAIKLDAKLFARGPVALRRTRQARPRPRNPITCSNATKKISCAPERNSPTTTRPNSARSTPNSPRWKRLSTRTCSRRKTLIPSWSATARNSPA